jgi:hypothetical protein
LGDLEFLPPWYSELRRTERTLSGYVMLAVAVVGYVCWCCSTTHTRLAEAASAASAIDAQVDADDASALDPAKAAAQVSQLLNAAQGLAEVRGRSPLSRDIASIAELIPPGVLLTELDVAPPDTPAATATQPPLDGLLVHLRGQAPRVADVANTQAAISRLRCVKQLRLSAARDLPGPGNVPREFEMTFALSSTDGGK